MSKLDTAAFRNTITDIKAMLPVQNFTEQDDQDLRAEVQTAIQLYIKHLNATTKDMMLIRLANANNALESVVSACSSAQLKMAQLKCAPEQTELRDAFVHYIQIIANQAAVYLGSDPN
jgi:DNA-binding protein Fis